MFGAKVSIFPMAYCVSFGYSPVNDCEERCRLASTNWRAIVYQGAGSCVPTGVLLKAQRPPPDLAASAA